MTKQIKYNIYKDPSIARKKKEFRKQENKIFIDAEIKFKNKEITKDEMHMLIDKNVHKLESRYPELRSPSVWE